MRVILRSPKRTFRDTRQNEIFCRTTPSRDARLVSLQAVGVAAPGMETGGPPETFEIFMFGAYGARSYGRYRGAERV